MTATAVSVPVDCAVSPPRQGFASPVLAMLTTLCSVARGSARPLTRRLRARSGRYMRGGDHQHISDSDSGALSSPGPKTLPRTLPKMKKDLAEWAGERICHHCKSLNSWREGTTSTPEYEVSGRR